ncbi:hypothetical protein ART_0234 [Arthrobacter sp. PAMC 25486]|nr:hypothetical protein ART_0234 [Arthrobacter sp. PAMC 25486]
MLLRQIWPSSSGRAGCFLRSAASDAEKRNSFSVRDGRFS